MPPLFRKVDKREAWILAGNGCRYPWLSVNDVPSDNVTDLGTRENTLSVYLIDPAGPSVDDIVCALASLRPPKPKPFTYLLFDSTIISALNLTLKEEEGKTPRAEVNEAHRDIVELTGRKLVELTYALYAGIREGKNEGDVRVKDVTAPRVHELVKEAAAQGRLRANEINQEWKRKLSS